MLVPAVGLQGVLARLLLQTRRHEHAQQSGHDRDQHQPADELGERELPAEQHPDHDPELEHQIGRANWNASAEAALAPFWKRLLAIAIAA